MQGDFRAASARTASLRRSGSAGVTVSGLTTLYLKIVLGLKWTFFFETVGEGVLMFFEATANFIPNTTLALVKFALVRSRIKASPKVSGL